ncbi:MAG TPA: hypothetical protein VJN70_13895, partial [Gemmatimonadaceae bacterium]|nr:hypothetical protein [Gemmatimonadaceae bacterium]
MDLVDLHSRSALDDAVETMRRFQAPWGVAGGWAIELLVNQRLRRHADIDVAILRAHQSRLWTDLEPNAVQVVIDGALRTWDASDWIPPPIHEVHLGWANGSRLEILLNEHDSTSDEWIYR